MRKTHPVRRVPLLSGSRIVHVPLHGDDLVMSRHLPRPHPPMMVTSIWALTDFTAANGGTCYVPGSHRSPYEPYTPGALVR